MKAVVCGHICIDITPTITEHESVSIERFFHPGSLILVDGIEITPGGAVTNTGLALSRLGFETTLIGRSGDDSFADILEDQLARRGGRAELSRRPDSRTSYSVILTPPGNDRIFLHDPGANNEFTADDVSDAALQGARVLHFGYPTVMRGVYEDGGANLKSLFARAHEHGILVSLDMALPDPDSEVGRRDWYSFLEVVLPEVDLFAPSFEEISYMVDRTVYDRVHKAAASADVVDFVRPDELRRISRTLLDMGAGVVVVKLGHLGLYLRTDHALSAPPIIDVERWRDHELYAPSFVIKSVVAGTGSGDVSIAGLLAAILSGATPERALQTACAAGAQACGSYDAVGTLASYDELQVAIDQPWPTIEVENDLFTTAFTFDTESRIWRGR